MTENDSVNRIVIPDNIWQQIEKTSLECRVAWGMGFPVISITLLKQILKREKPQKPSRSIAKE